ncbi:ABC transporter ATP-binding protein [Sporosarcina ureilytica]|uniref:Branched-chain amino acid ABC transporter ATP-binding protein n=1 Tax=Sporosarcina ureilytica TaxID=298596 RepID=A0A1D8JFD2_9BACL|nr:ABC transporter ATP-binding protein [Sporosarcina ureilytica]AOV07422.1 branched-chain amino acid ABC transporter ATP-binding protein [Sporosarcina ureilytica]
MIKVTDLETGYGNIQILRKISFEIKKGEVVSILGTNGAGKTTTLRALSGLLPVWGGEIYFEGQSIHKATTEQIVKSGLIQVPEDRKLFTEMTVLENLELGAFIPGVRKNLKKNIDYCYELFPILKDRKSQIVGTMSGGQQQMLAIGRALMAEPKLLILDEPSIGLSPLLTQQVFDIISDIKEQGVTILLVEQNVNQALRLADRGYVIENGEIVMKGNAKDLLNDENLKASYLGTSS